MGSGMLLLWLIPIAVLIWLFAKGLNARSGTDETSKSPREILDARYARGEISHDEYLERRAYLEGHNKTSDT